MVPIRATYRKKKEESELAEEIRLETECKWGTASNFCEDGFEVIWIAGARKKIGLCPQCHGRGSVPTTAGAELLEFVKFWADKEWP